MGGPHRCVESPGIDFPFHERASGWPIWGLRDSTAELIPDHRKPGGWNGPCETANTFANTSGAVDKGMTSQTRDEPNMPWPPFPDQTCWENPRSCA